ncbi:DUF1190 domain-containing protein [Brevundimonas sp. NIBR11]|uniref:DUF1190 domain-containing protein n=1 Tax=Brevundimonas sp. NIBR11 TaxID=3015999 RepID=UPI0022EFDE44|nr:DUF1190 domain-containing protein [Brevundimonas sp. NIBR11]WGM31984.1 hypothetical protein KKHFBJBL_02235 [Brevundimonas sp. NIBR11]
MSDTPSPAAQETTTIRRMKRSKTLQITSLMATASFSLAACGAPQVAVPEPEPALAYTSLDECKAANDITDAECDAADANARAQAAETAPRYATQSECEGQWGPDQCRPNQQGGGSFFTPLLTGFVIGQLLNGGGYRGGGALYRDRDGNYQNGYGGGYLSRDYRTGRQVANGRDYGTDVARQAPSRVQSRTTVVSRGGFGGGGRGYGG